MTKAGKIWTTVGVLVAIGATVGVILYLRKKKKDEGESDDKISKTIDTPEVKKTKGQKASPKDEKALELLKQDIAKAYYAMEILENRGGVVYNTKTGNPVASGLDQGTWIQLKKRKNEISKMFANSTKHHDTLMFGKDLINKLNKDIDKIFNPSKYNVNQAWYKEYIQKYPEGIKGQA